MVGLFSKVTISISSSKFGAGLYLNFQGHLSRRTSQIENSPLLHEMTPIRAIIYVIIFLIIDLSCRTGVIIIQPVRGAILKKFYLSRTVGQSLRLSPVVTCLMDYIWIYTYCASSLYITVHHTRILLWWVYQVPWLSIYSITLPFCSAALLASIPVSCDTLRRFWRFHSMSEIKTIPSAKNQYRYICIAHLYTKWVQFDFWYKIIYT